jgi:hypothetical protein
LNPKRLFWKSNQTCPPWNSKPPHGKIAITNISTSRNSKTTNRRTTYFFKGEMWQHIFFKGEMCTLNVDGKSGPQRWRLGHLNKRTVSLWHCGQIITERLKPGENNCFENSATQWELNAKRSRKGRKKITGCLCASTKFPTCSMGTRVSGPRRPSLCKRHIPKKYTGTVRLSKHRECILNGLTGQLPWHCLELHQNLPPSPKPNKKHNVTKNSPPSTKLWNFQEISKIPDKKNAGSPVWSGKIIQPESAKRGTAHTNVCEFGKKLEIWQSRICVVKTSWLYLCLGGQANSKKKQLPAFDRIQKSEWYLLWAF